MTRRMTLIIALAACGGGSTERPTKFGGDDRPVTLVTPERIDAGRRYPLVMVLHGYSANSFVQLAYFGLKDLATRGDAFVIAPDGLVDSTGKQFWNADPVCCDFDRRNPDDVAYLGGIVDDVIDSWPVDTKAVVAVGHSNGGFMAYRLACDRSDVFTGIVALAGSAAMVTCNPPQPVNVLHVHGTDDQTVPFSVADPSFTQWAGRNGCGDTTTHGDPLDLDTAIAGAETTTVTANGCPAGGATALWAIDGAGHVPTITGKFEEPMWQWLMANRRP